MIKKSIKIKTTNQYAGGCFTAPLYIGSEGTLVNVFLDTGSSNLAISTKHYKPNKDKTMKTTNLAQYTAYADGSYWQGAVIKTRVVVKHETSRRQLSGANVAVITGEKNMFQPNMQGILGLAYQELDTASEYNKPTWPKFDASKYDDNPTTTIAPYFAQLARRHIEPNKFAFYALRSQWNYGQIPLAKDPLNTGYCVLGGGEEYKELYTGEFQNVKIKHDGYYNTNLKAVRIGNTASIPIKPPTKNSELNSNSIVDSGTSTLCFPTWLFHKVMAKFKQIDPSFPQIIQQSQDTDDIKYSEKDLEKWPNIYFTMEGEKGDVELKMLPKTYWQINCTEDGAAYCAIDSESDNQTILGLPFMNNFYCVFDRSAGRGMGLIKFAQIKSPD
ncbi:MAG: hypothetical protein KTR18_15235 [Acidiferrobacterales bacterium]|nr:hypothetical protein [Acidiferrobacterales bacterium]